jgi:hypothetical protein
MTTINGVTIINRTFPNGNSDIKPEILSFVDRYQTFLRKTAEAILGLSETLVQAECDLNSVDFLIFCENVGLVKGSPTYSKLKQIGETADRFRPFVNRLPNTWTTIYKLSKLAPDQFASIAGSLTPFITSKEIDHHIGANGPKASSQAYEFKIGVSVLDGERKAEVYAALLALKDQFKFALSEDRRVLEELKTIKLAKAA